MSIYVNPTETLLADYINKDLYVDKSLLLDKLNTLIDDPINKFVCISRPRRFGKTLTTSLLTSYYSKGAKNKKLFSKLKISETKHWKKYLNKFNVIKIDLLSEYENSFDKPNFLLKLTKDINKELKEQFPRINIDIDESIAINLCKIYDKKKQKFIIIIDEYDLLIRSNVPKVELDAYLSFLNGLFKSSNVQKAIHLSYLTGILPITKDKVESKLNMFKEYTMTHAGDFGGFIGFTEDEVKTLCTKYNMDFNSCKDWYDGYTLGNIQSIYTPQAVIDSMRSHKYESFWADTGTFTNIQKAIELDFDGVRQDIICLLTPNKHIEVDVSQFLNTINDFKSKYDIFTFLIHLGYLAYNENTHECWIPNKEVQLEWNKAIDHASNMKEYLKKLQESDNLLEATLNLDTETVAKAIADSHRLVTSHLTYNNEGSFQSAIYLAYYTATKYYNINLEYASGDGFADVAFIPQKQVLNKPPIIIELKVDSTADSALNQIKKKKYGSDLDNYYGKILLVGINYNKKTRLHQCLIDVLEK